MIQTQPQTQSQTHRQLLKTVLLLIALNFGVTLFSIVHAQDTVTGAFEGTVTDSQTGAAIEGANIEIVNQQTQLVIPKRSSARGRWYQGLLAPGLYTIRVSAPNYQTKQIEQRLFITRTGEVVPVPVSLDPLPAGVTPTPTPLPSNTPTTSGTSPTPTPSPQANVASTSTEADSDIRGRINASDAQRSDAFTEEEVSTLPLGGTSITRTFDQLALFLPGVAPPPQTLGNGSGPGVGAGVGSAGQFSVNGLRSRANNFTVDGSDNNDEDIGVRRQGFVALIPQSIESIKEYQVIMSLAPAQFGRNIGAQVNAVSKSGGNDTHGTIYGFFNSSQLNARNFFDTTNGNAVTQLNSASGQSVLLDGKPLLISNGSGSKDSFTFGQFGFVLGGAIKKERLFYFLSAEREIINAVQEASFAVPTIEQRGAFNSGASGIFKSPVDNRPNVLAFPTTSNGDAVFSLYPFANNPTGVYGANTFTQTLPASGRGNIFSLKLDDEFELRGRQQSVTGRYNFTQDARTLPVTGEAIFSSLRPYIRTQNFSFFFNSQVNDANARKQVFNQVRLSYGRTRLRFDEARDTQYQVQSKLLPNEPFLLNAPLLLNSTLPISFNNGLQSRANTGAVRYTTNSDAPTVEDVLGPLGQLKIAGFSPIGVDVFNFPQNRIDNTYQIADNLTVRAGEHHFAFGEDIRRSELNSFLPRNARPLLVFGGAPQFAGSFDFFTNAFSDLQPTGRFNRPESFAAAGAPSVFSQTLARGGETGINLRFYQYNFYGQDQWRVRRNLSISYGLRYEYNTPPREVNGRIENTFSDPSLNLIPGLKSFIAGRTSIFETNRTNFAPRIGVAFSPNPISTKHITVIRGGYGLFYDQILGAVVSQSRSVYPDYLTVNLGGGFANLRYLGQCSFDVSDSRCPFEPANPRFAKLFGAPIVLPGTLNTLNPSISFAQLVSLVNSFGTGASGSARVLPPINGFGATLPTRRLLLPRVHQYNFSVEQQLGQRTTLSVAYIGTVGQRLLRFTTPNGGENSFIVPLEFCPDTAGPGGGLLVGCSITNSISNISPQFFGLVLPPGTRIAPTRDKFIGGRPVSGVGTINQFETTASSRYDSLQVQLRGRLQNTLQYQISYTFSHAIDDVSDVFDLAGASALPQDNFNLSAERGNANFDARHRFTYNFIYDFPKSSDRSRTMRFLLNGLQIAGTGRIQSGQPFTVNSIFDVNLDGNLTDRLNSTNGIVVTGDRRQPLKLTVDPSTLLAPVGQDGAVGRNTFRAGGIVELDLAVNKRFAISERQNFLFRVEIFNFINRANYGIPVRLLEAPSFGQATNTVTPGRRVQFALKYSF